MKKAKKPTDTERLDWLMEKLSPSWAAAWNPKTRDQIDAHMNLDAAMSQAKRGKRG